MSRSDKSRRYWGLAIGEGGRYVDVGKRLNFIAIGWDELGDLSRLRLADYQDAPAWAEFRRTYVSTYSNDSQVQVGIGAGQVWAFVTEMRAGDIVVVRHSTEKAVLVGEIKGDYEWVPLPDDGCPYQHRRAVRWLSSVLRTDLPERLKQATTAWLTIFRLDPYRDEIEFLLGVEHEGGSDIVSGDALVESLIHRLLGMPPQEFEHFVGHVLSLVGFTHTVTKLVGDGGVDIIGRLNAEGLAEVSLHVQVKRTIANVGNREVLQLRGTLGQEDHGAFITLGGFTKQAREEAQAAGKKAIRLIDGESFVELVLKTFDGLSGEYQESLGLRRRETPLVDHFVMGHAVDSDPLA